MNKQEITIRSVQHYLYCPHRWGLLEIDRAWAENLFVTKANLLHERVHDPEGKYTSRGKKIFTSVPVFNDREEYGLYGVTDCLELTEAENGVPVLGSKEKYKIRIVEYKPSKPKNALYHEDDLMQVFAQKLCVDYVFESDCEGILYYSDVKKRVSLPLKDSFEVYDQKLRQILSEMREYLEKGVIPPVRKGQKCSGCSMKDLCMPSFGRNVDLRAELKTMEHEDF